MNTIERLTKHLKELDHVELRGAGVEAVMEAGRSYRRRRTIGLTVAGLVAVAVLAFGAYTLQAALVDSDDEEVADIDGAAVDGDLEWVSTPSPLGYASQLVADGGTVYALTTAPGVVPPDGVADQALFATTDGQGWTLEVLPADMWVSDLAQGSGTLYAIGTAPGVDFIATEASVRIGMSSDDGLSWDYTDLALEATAPGGAVVGGSHARTSIAVGDGKVVAAVTTQFITDYGAMIPSEFQGDGFGNYETDVGVAVVDWALMEAAMDACRAGAGEGPAAGGVVTTTAVGGAGITTAAPCGAAQADDPTLLEEAVVYRATWDEVGLDGRPVFSELFVSDGGDFEAVDSPFPATGSTDVVAVEGGFVGYSHLGDSARLWFSADGRSWEERPSVPGVQQVFDVGVIGDDIVVAGGGFDAGGVVVASAQLGGGGWTVHDLPREVVPGAEVFVPAADIGSGVVAIAVQALTPDGQFGSVVILHSTDLVTWAQSGSDQMIGGRSVGYVDSLVVADGSINVSISLGDAGSRIWSVGIPVQSG